MDSLREEMRNGHPHQDQALCTREYSGLRGIYARLSVGHQDESAITFNAIWRILETHGIPSASVIYTGLHITIIHSITSAINVIALERALGDSAYDDVRYKYRIKELTYWGGDSGKGYLILNVESPDIRGLHSKFSALGADHTYDEFSPHITVAQEVGPLSLRVIKCIDEVNALLFRQSLCLKDMYATHLCCSDLQRVF